MNVHKRCHKNVTNNCGLDTKRFSEVLNDLGLSSERLSIRKKAQLFNDQSPSRSCSSLNERSHTSPLPNMAMDHDDSFLCNDISNRLSLNNDTNKNFLINFDDEPKILQENNLNEILKSASKPQYSLESFNFLKVLGKGSFGKVTKKLINLI